MAAAGGVLLWNRMRSGLPGALEGGERGDRDQRGALMVWGASATLVTDSDLCSSLLAPWLSLNGDDSGDLLPGGNLPPETDPHGANAFPATS